MSSKPRAPTLSGEDRRRQRSPKSKPGWQTQLIGFSQGDRIIDGIGVLGPATRDASQSSAYPADNCIR